MTDTNSAHDVSRADGGNTTTDRSEQVGDGPYPAMVAGIDPGVAVDLGEHRELVRQQAGSGTFDDPNVFMLEYGADRIPLTRGQIRAIALAAGFDVTDSDSDSNSNTDTDSTHSATTDTPSHSDQ